ncbi:MAG TPA: hypothetical protein VF033_10300, partial [Steroidobacteraceae bacterium]
MNALIDHLWQSLLCVCLLAILAAIARGRTARVRLWLWRVAAVKMLVPFTVLGAIGRWYGFPVRFHGDPPPASMVQRVNDWSPVFSMGTWFDSAAARA